MQNSAENDLNALSSWLLGITGTSLLLIPFHYNFGLPVWWLYILGIFCYLVAMSNQSLFVLTPSPRRRLHYRSASIFFLLGLGALFIWAGYFIEGIIFWFVGVMQWISITRLKEQFAGTDPLNLTAVLIGFSSAAYLIFSGNEYARLNIASSYKVILVILFLLASSFELFRKYIPSRKLDLILSRIQVIPWMAWCLIFISTTSVIHLIGPIILATSILLNGLIPLDQLKLSENDILGNRAVKIIGTLETTLLIFLSAMLIVMDLALNTENRAVASAHNATFIFFIIVAAILYYELITIVMAVNGLMSELTRTEYETESFSDSNLSLWDTRLARYIKPFLRAREGLRSRLNTQTDQISILAHQLTNEKKRNSQITLLMELSQQLENQFDQPVAAQLAVNSLERALQCDLASLYIYEPDDEKEFMLLAAAGKHASLIPPSFRLGVSEGVLGRAVRQRKTQIINDIRADADYVRFENEPHLSAVMVPLIFNGFINGVVKVNSNDVNAFSSIDVWLVEAVAAELTRAWERSRYHQRLMNLVQIGSQLSSMSKPEATVHEVASIAREILQARFAFVHINLGQERNFTLNASSGDAPHLLESLQNSAHSEALIQQAFYAVQPFRIRDIRKYSSTSHLTIDQSGLKSMIAIPIRWHRLSIGAILAFGKQNEVFFSENDQSLAELLSIQAAGVFESTWLQQELRESLRTTSLLYRLSTQIIQSENLQTTAVDIAETAHKIAKSAITGIMLFDREGNVIAETQIDSDGPQTGRGHPMTIIKDVLDSGQLIYMSQGNSLTRACLPIQTPILKYGIIWMDIPEDKAHKSIANPNDLQALANQTAIALERSVLLVESRRQATEIKAAYDILEVTYDQTLAALMSALDARDRETEGHSVRVSHLTAKLGEALNFTHEQQKALERGSLLHDIGKIGISDTILHKPGPLSEKEWELMKCHPDIGAKIVEGIPFLEDTIPLIRHHQERWDGTGYPAGLRGKNIPILARVFSIVDAFDALTSNRPYRQKISINEAIEYVSEQAGIIFDPEIVEVFKKLVMENQSESFFVEN